MAFQPFGYRFEVRSLLTPEEAKAAIRSSKQVLFDAVSGPRGWVIGPFLCLWMYASLRSGPMLIGRIRSHEQGSCIIGRAGSDLNGTAYMAAICAILPVMMIQGMWQGDPALDGAAVYIALAIIAAGVSLLWMAHKDRAQADPLVDFLEQTLRPRRPARS